MSNLEFIKASKKGNLEEVRRILDKVLIKFIGTNNFEKAF